MHHIASKEKHMTKPRAVEVFPAARGVVWPFALKESGQ